MTKIYAFLILHRDFEITTPKQYPHYMEINLSRINHEPFEIHIHGSLGCPLLHMFVVVKHQPCSFQIPFWLHAPHSINDTNRIIK
jgi:hypothetical protein